MNALYTLQTYFIHQFFWEAFSQTATAVQRLLIYTISYFYKYIIYAKGSFKHYARLCYEKLAPLAPGNANNFVNADLR